MKRLVDYALTVAMSACLVALYGVIAAGALVALSGCTLAPEPLPPPLPPGKCLYEGEGGYAVVGDCKCVRPWLDDAYKTGRAIPAPGPHANVPICND